MTDDTGIFQHAIYTIPNLDHGYCTDDNARALIVSTHLAELELGNGDALTLASRYLAFIGYAFNHETGRFRNFMAYQRHWLEESGSDDSHGRTLWALGTVLGRSNTPALQSMAGWLFEQALPAILETTSPRAWARAAANCCTPIVWGTTNVPIWPGPTLRKRSARVRICVPPCCGRANSTLISASLPIRPRC